MLTAGLEAHLLQVLGQYSENVTPLIKAIELQ